MRPSFSPLDRGHPCITFFEQPDDDDFEPLKMCDIKSCVGEAQEYMADEVSKLLYQRLRTGGSKNGADDGWYERKGDGDGEGGSPGGSGCGDLDGGQCDWDALCEQSYAKNWWIMQKIEYFMSIVRLIKQATTFAWMDSSYYTKKIKEALLMKGVECENPATLLSLLSNFGNSLGAIGAAIGNTNPITGAALDPASAILSLTKDDVAKEEQEV